MAKIKHRKPANVRKDAHLRVRLSKTQLGEIKNAAQHAGISVSAWVIERLLSCARNEHQATTAGTTLVTR